MSNRNRAVFPAVVALAAALVAAVIVGVQVLTSGGGGASGGTGGTDAAEGPPDGWQQLVRAEPGDPMARGDVDAPVVLIAYSEFQCPFCGKFARDTEPELVEEYVDEGILRIEWKDFPYLGPESHTAALAGRAAAEQDAFWAFHDAMYADQLPPNSGDLDEDHVAAVAEDIGLDVDRFLEDMRSDAAERAVDRDFAEGQAIGVTGTPTFVVNGVPVVGAQPIDVFRQVIEDEAAKAGAGG
ncbi:DsbA family protein [Nocardioides sp. GCM10027113]|uniref:DsbA family protein n=1 Tax=unclassified Nocardioides TaxID=2615069 RepID=UPI00360B022C